VPAGLQNVSASLGILRDARPQSALAADGFAVVIEARR